MAWSACARLALPDVVVPFLHACQTDFKISLNSFSSSSKTTPQYLSRIHLHCQCIPEMICPLLCNIMEDTPTITSPSSHCDTVQRLSSVCLHLPLMASDAPQLPGSCSRPVNTAWTNGRITETHPFGLLPPSCNALTYARRMFHIGL